jgi:hypothetical protein
MNTYGVWFEGDGNKIPPHWLIGEDMESDWIGSKEEAEELAAIFGGQVLEKKNNNVV